MGKKYGKYFTNCQQKKPKQSQEKTSKLLRCFYSKKSKQEIIALEMKSKNHLVIRITAVDKMGHREVQ